MVEREEAAQSLFGEVAAKRRLAAEWRVSAGYPSEDAALHGRYVDLVILGQTDPDNIETALFSAASRGSGAGRRPAGAGRPVCRPVRGMRPPRAGRLECEPRGDARDQRCDAAARRGGNGDGAERRSGAKIPGRTARCRGWISPRIWRATASRRDVETTVSGGIGVGNALLSWASDIGADLLVMGAYGHTRVRELLLGGATRTILESMTVPVLMSH